MLTNSPLRARRISVGALVLLATFATACSDDLADTSASASVSTAVTVVTTAAPETSASSSTTSTPAMPTTDETPGTTPPEDAQGQPGEPAFPNPEVRSISYTNDGSTYTFVADADRCQQSEQWAFSGPDPIGPFLSDYPNWQCWDRAHERSVNLTSGTWTVTLTLTGNGSSSSASVTLNVP